MKSKRLRPFILILTLVAVSSIAMAYSNRLKSNTGGPTPGPGQAEPDKSGVVSLSGHLVQHKVLKGSNGEATLSLIMRADDVLNHKTGDDRNVDLVIVMDRSGSMSGRKLEDAKKAVLKLLAGLTAKDRFALIAYSDGVQKYTDLIPVTDESRGMLYSTIRSMQAGGSTNLGAGLQVGIDALMHAEKTPNAGKVILISDGLANRGITDSDALGRMASIAVEGEFSVSTVGVGAEFNEYLMTRIADRGAGSYYYLENPEAFAEVFQKEFYFAKTQAVTSVAVRVPLTNGISLVNASGYPIHTADGYAVFYPGNLRSGQERKLFLTIRVPTHKAGTTDVGGIHVEYVYNGQPFISNLAKSFQIACVENKRDVFSSIDKKKWEEKVLKDDYNRLKQEVASEIKAGRKERALDRIKAYYHMQTEANAVVGSGKVAETLSKGLGELESMVQDTFQGSPAAVEQKQKLNSKSLQYEGYKGQRAN